MKNWTASALLAVISVGGAEAGTTPKPPAHAAGRGGRIARARHAPRHFEKQYPNALTSLYAVDGEDPTIVYNKDAEDRQWAPASTTKLMLLLCADDIRREKKLPWQTPVVITHEAAISEEGSLHGSGAHLPAHTVMTLEESYSFALLPSDNRVAKSLPAALGLTEREMVERMNDKADALLMTRTRYKNVTGWEDEGQVTTAHDETLMMREAMHRYPEIMAISQQLSFTFRGVPYENHNDLLKGEVAPHIKVKGGKTGMAGGFDIVVAAEADGHCVLVCQLGAKTARKRREAVSDAVKDAFARRAELLTARDAIKSAVFPAAPVLADFTLKPH